MLISVIITAKNQYNLRKVIDTERLKYGQIVNNSHLFAELLTIIGEKEAIMNKVVKIKIVVIFTLIATFLTSLFCVSAMNNVHTVKSDVSFLRIVLDAGHGGVDGGAVGTLTKVSEKDLNLKVVKQLEYYFKNANFNVVLTRTSDDGLYGSAKNNLKRADMKKRKEIIEEIDPAIVISVHMNKYSGATRRGAQVFYKKGDEKGKCLAVKVQNAFNEMQESVKQYSPLTGDYYLLNVSNCPAIIAECGFLSNPEDEKLLCTEEYRNKLAYAIFTGTVNYLAEIS